MRNLKIFLMAILVILTISCATTRQEQKAAVSARASEDFLKAAASEDINEVRKLIEAGVDVNAADEWGVTALMVAAFKGDSEIVRLLIDHRADVDRTCIHINAVTHALVKAAFKDLGPSAKTIFVPPEYPNPTTALMVTAYYGHAEVARLLIDAGAQVDAANSAGTTALMLAAESGHADCARLLIDAGAQVDFTPMSNGDTPLYVAALCGHPEIVRMFVTAGANVNARSTDGNTALMAAAHCGNIKIVQLLIEAGTDINAFNAKGQTAMVLASDSGYNEVVRMLKQVGANE
jgi:ankyrin repeat protein